ncbi:unnamed protein product, partial [Prorocentrum cordatum]
PQQRKPRGEIGQTLSNIFENAESTRGLRRGDFVGLQEAPMPIELTQAVMPTAIRAALKNAQNTVALESTVFSEAHLRADHEVRATMKLKGQSFVQETTRLRQQHRQEISEGRIVEELGKLGNRVGAQTAANIKQYLGGIRADQTITHDTLASQAKHCRVSHTRD